MIITSADDLRQCHRRLIRLIVADITRDVIRRRRLGWRA